MKCPKCGYNSFEFYDSCKKCANDLTGYKATYGLTAIVLPLEARTAMAEALLADTALSDQSPEVDNEQVDMFSFDIPDDVARTKADDPFNFADEPIAPPHTGGAFTFDEGQQLAQAKADEDAFADLLEATSQKEVAPSAAADPTINSGESGLSSFSWDDTPNDAATGSAKPTDDDFDTLFGDLDDPTKK
jgi:predicted  nucleic acid-binding Zn-ribbon protein